MKSVFEVYRTLWPEDKVAELKPLLSQVPVLHHPEDRGLYTKVMSHLVVLVVKDIPLKDLMTLADLGFEHIVQMNREDFAKELLASSLMVLRPEAFLKNPIPFFLTGFDSATVTSNPDRHLIMRFTKQKEKSTLLEWLGVFLDRNSATAALRDICLQAADELVSNALFNAPIRPSGKRAFKDLARDSDIELPTTQAGTLFACFADDRVIVGCEDAFGSLEQQAFLSHLREIFREDLATVKYSTGGAGLGFRYLLENSANFYILVNKGKSTLVTCSFLLKGLKANLSVAKHVHISFK